MSFRLFKAYPKVSVRSRKRKYYVWGEKKKKKFLIVKKNNNNNNLDISNAKASSIGLGTYSIIYLLFMSHGSISRTCSD